MCELMRVSPLPCISVFRLGVDFRQVCQFRRGARTAPFTLRVKSAAPSLKSKAESRVTERDGLLICEWGVPIRQGSGRNARLVSAGFRPESPLACRIQFGKCAREFCAVAQAIQHTGADDRDPFHREALERCHAVRRHSARLHRRSSILTLMTTTPSSAKRWSTAILFAGIVLLGGCTRMVRMYESWNVSGYDGEIRRAGQAIAASSNTTQRSAAYADRADAYAEKARYSRLMKLIADEEYNKLFDLAVQDYNQAIALDPDNARDVLPPGQCLLFSRRPGHDLRSDAFGFSRSGQS